MEVTLSEKSDKKVIRVRYVILFLFVNVACSTLGYAETYYELSAGLGQYKLNISEKRGIDVDDEANTLSLGVGAYRYISERRAWGAVIETMQASSRSEMVEGSGHILGLRPVNFVYNWNPSFATEVYGGIASYKWEKKANGYYIGGNVRYQSQRLPFGAALDIKWFNDLAYDSNAGDIIVIGSHVGLYFIYTFNP